MTFNPELFSSIMNQTDKPVPFNCSPNDPHYERIQQLKKQFDESIEVEYKGVKYDITSEAYLTAGYGEFITVHLLQDGQWIKLFTVDEFSELKFIYPEPVKPQLLKMAIADSLEDFDKWVQITGAIMPETSLYFELESIITDAVKRGAAIND
jgi:hypothetical protein